MFKTESTADQILNNPAISNKEKAIQAATKLNPGSDEFKEFLSESASRVVLQDLIAALHPAEIDEVFNELYPADRENLLCLVTQVSGPEYLMLFVKYAIAPRIEENIKDAHREAERDIHRQRVALDQEEAELERRRKELKAQEEKVNERVKAAQLSAGVEIARQRSIIARLQHDLQDERKQNRKIKLMARIKDY